MPVKKTMVSLQLRQIEKEMFEDRAKDHGISLSELFRKGAYFFGALPPGFMYEIEKYSEEMKIPLTTIVIHAIQKLFAQYKAWLNVFGGPPPGWMREFKWQDGKLITGDDLSKILELEYTELFQMLKDNLVESLETGEACFLDKEMAFQVMAQK